MVELAIFARRDPPGPGFRRGDVIEILPDGARWGRSAIRDPAMRMLRVATPEVADGVLLETFLSPELELYPRQLGRLTNIRGFYFDLEGSEMPGPMRGWVANDRRRVPVFDSRMNAREIVARFQRRREPLTTPWLAGMPS